MSQQEIHFIACPDKELLFVFKIQIDLFKSNLFQMYIVLFDWLYSDSNMCYLINYVNAISSSWFCTYSQGFTHAVEELPRNLIKIEFVSLVVKKKVPVVQQYRNSSVKNFKKFKKVQLTFNVLLYFCETQILCCFK